MCRICLPVSLLCLVIGCQTARPARSMKMGPPPPGYVKIVGEPVPNWQPVHLRAEVARAEPSLQWWSLGPRPILNEAWSGNDDASGRVVDIAIHPVDPDIAYVASASGGIWKTVDEGAAWTPLTDELPILNHGCVAIDPADAETIYVGTGEYTTWTTGDGVFRSADGGSTWERIATTEQVGTQCSSLIVDPSDPQRIHLTGNDGYVRSDDGGSTWVNRLPDAASDLIMHPQDPSILYLGRHGQGVYRSTDGGGNWAKLSNGLPASGISRIILAIAPSNPNRLYAAINASNAQVKGMYRSSDGGNTWSRVNGYTFPGPQAWYDLAVIVDPEDEDTVYFGDTPLYRSTDGGVTRDYITTAPGGGTVHVDIHALTFGPDGALWVGCDGGMWKSTDRAATWTNLNATLNVTQFYNIALNPLDPAQVIGGTQDNGTAGRELDIEPWPQVISGDGGFCAFDHNDPSIKYTTYVYLTVFRFDASGVTDITGPWHGVEPVGFIAPLVMDPNDSHTLLGGTNRVWRTHNADTAADWAPISTSEVTPAGYLYAIAIADDASDTIYTGSTGGEVFVTTDTVTWHDRSAGLPDTGSVSDILIDPDDPARAHVSYHRTTGERVLRTEDYGLTWTDITGTLPSGVAARALAVDFESEPDGLYVGSGAGVYFSLDDGSTWTKDGTDLPNVNVGDLAIDPLRRTITVGTYGRGTWRADLPDLVACGDGVAEPPELCDTGIPPGEPGACPTAADCESSDPCEIGTLQEPGTCQAHCDLTHVTEPAHDDGCCPPGANAVNDHDCLAVCGNEVCEPDEAVTCPTDCACITDAECDDRYACTIDRCVGGTCAYNGVSYGDVDQSGVVNVFDLFCILAGIAGEFGDCSFIDADIHPCHRNEVLNLFDVLAALDAIAGDDPCCGG